VHYDTASLAEACCSVHSVYYLGGRCGGGLVVACSVLGIFLSFARGEDFFGQKHTVDVGQHSTRGNRHRSCVQVRVYVLVWRF